MDFLEILSTFTNFFLGMVTGMVLFSAIFVFFFIRGRNLNVDEIKRPTIDVDEEILRDMVKGKQKQFKRTFKSGTEGIAKETFNVSYELMGEIARYFFPDSQYPMLELSVNELLRLNHHITDRIDELLDKPVIKNAKNLQVIRVMQMYDKKRQVEETKIVKAAKRIHLPKIMKYGGAALNAVNPVYWFRKAVISTSVNAMTKRVCLVVIGIVGEETVKVYSKALFEEPIDLDMVENSVNKMIEEGIDQDEELN